MWFAEQLNTFLNLGECKEYPIMARSKSIPGSKTSRATTPAAKEKEQEQIGTGDAVRSSAVNAGEAPPVEVAAEGKVAPEAKVMPAARTAQEPRKLEVVKNESRKNVFPINLDDEIRRRAFELYQQRGTGSGSGSEAEDWLNAEREVRQRYRQQSA